MGGASLMRIPVLWLMFGYPGIKFEKAHQIFLLSQLIRFLKNSLSGEIYATERDCPNHYWNSPYSTRSQSLIAGSIG